METQLKVFSGNAHRELALAICRVLDVPLSDAMVSRFSDGEIRIKINENVRGADVFIIQPTFPPGDNLLELLFMVDAARRASAKRITAVIPYFGYARQDKKDEPRVPISAKLVANLISISGVDRVLTMDLHAEQIQGFFDIPVDHLYAAPVIVDYFKGLELGDIVVVSPDAGRAKRARGIAKRLGDYPIAIVDKRRPAPNRSEVVHIVGEVKGKVALVIDDIIDTGGTIVQAAYALFDRGAKEIVACCTHPILSGKAVEKLIAAPVKQLVVTDTIPLRQSMESLADKVQVLSVASLLAEAIRRIHNEESVSSLFI